jgi:hypothetical protein
MKTFEVTVYESYTATYLIEAESEEEAANTFGEYEPLSKRDYGYDLGAIVEVKDEEEA